MFVLLNLDESDVYINLLQIEKITIFGAREEASDSPERERFRYYVELRYASGEASKIVSGSTDYRAEYERKMGRIRQGIRDVLLQSGLDKGLTLEFPADDD